MARARQRPPIRSAVQGHVRPDATLGRIQPWIRHFFGHHDVTRIAFRARLASSKKKGKQMNLSSHLQELRKKHQDLSMEVETAQRSPAFDDLEITALKKQKLKIKEEIERLSHQA